MLGLRPFVITLPTGRTLTCVGVDQSYLILLSNRKDDQYKIYRYSVDSDVLMPSYEEIGHIDSAEMKMLPPWRERIAMGFITQIARGKVTSREVVQGLRIDLDAKIECFRSFTGGFTFDLGGKNLTVEDVCRLLIQRQ